MVLALHEEIIRGNVEGLLLDEPFPVILPELLVVRFIAIQIPKGSSGPIGWQNRIRHELLLEIRSGQANLFPVEVMVAAILLLPHFGPQYNYL